MEIPIIILLAMAIAICVIILYNIVVSYFKPFFKVNDYLLAYRPNDPFKKDVYYFVTDIKRSHNKRYYIRVILCTVDMVLSDTVEYNYSTNTYTYRDLLFRLHNRKVYDSNSILEEQHRKLK